MELSNFIKQKDVSSSLVFNHNLDLMVQDFQYLFREIYALGSQIEDAVKITDTIVNNTSQAIGGLSYIYNILTPHSIDAQLKSLPVDINGITSTKLDSQSCYAKIDSSFASGNSYTILRDSNSYKDSLYIVMSSDNGYIDIPVYVTFTPYTLIPSTKLYNVATLYLNLNTKNPVDLVKIRYTDEAYQSIDFDISKKSLSGRCKIDLPSPIKVRRMILYFRVHPYTSTNMVISSAMPISQLPRTYESDGVYKIFNFGILKAAEVALLGQADVNIVKTNISCDLQNPRKLRLHYIGNMYHTAVNAVISGVYKTNNETKSLSVSIPVIDSNGYVEELHSMQPGETIYLKFIPMQDTVQCYSISDSDIVALNNITINKNALSISGITSSMQILARYQPAKSSIIPDGEITQVAKTFKYSFSDGKIITYKFDGINEKRAIKFVLQQLLTDVSVSIESDEPFFAYNFDGLPYPNAVLSGLNLILEFPEDIYPTLRYQKFVISGRPAILYADESVPFFLDEDLMVNFNPAFFKDKSGVLINNLTLSLVPYTKYHFHNIEKAYLEYA